MSKPDDKNPPRPVSPKPASLISWLSHDSSQEKADVEPLKKELPKEPVKEVPKKKTENEYQLLIVPLKLQMSWGFELRKYCL
ncbi:unnamed protein product [Schistosoma margrebowiei]|uniref:Uncharacterized protein n=1 Tax=Schistosoma margrebowiei TaxID=48269 RepID=A0A183LFH7_9TREM|nr:unnamed protein product [Schistosoma margrebowiei]